MPNDLPDELRHILETLPNGTMLRVWSSGELIGVSTDRVEFTLRIGEWIRSDRDWLHEEEVPCLPNELLDWNLVSRPERPGLTVNFPSDVFNPNSYVDDFGGGGFVLDGGRYGGNPVRNDNAIDNGESPYDPDTPDKTLDEYIASWDALIREVRDSD